MLAEIIDPLAKILAGLEMPRRMAKPLLLGAIE